MPLAAVEPVARIVEPLALQRIERLAPGQMTRQSRQPLAAQRLLPVRRADDPPVPRRPLRLPLDRKSVVSGKRVSVRVALGGSRQLTKQPNQTKTKHHSII